jgi:hypothetical protein
MAPRSLVFANAGDPTIDPLVREHRLAVAEVVPELDGTRFFEVLEK